MFYLSGFINKVSEFRPALFIFQPDADFNPDIFYPSEKTFLKIKEQQTSKKVFLQA